MALDPGTRLGPYEILAPAGAGGMGEVYRARDTRLNRQVAIKTLSAAAAASPQALERFEREAKAIASLSHPGICPLYDVGTEPFPFLVMELLDGETLHQRIQRGPVDVDALIETGLALADALAAAHARGVIHRDLKPANVIMTAHGPKIVDFGLARITETITLADSATAYPTRAAATPLTDAGTAVGTVSYMAPEQLRGESLDTRTDLFSLGLVLYEMATGRRAFDGSTNAVMSAAILHEQPPAPAQRRPDIPPRLNETILNLLEKDRDVRTQTAAEVRAELMRLKRGLVSPRTGDPAPVAAPQDARRSAPMTTVGAPASSSDAQVAAGLIRRHPALVSGLLLIVLAAVGAALYFQTTRDPASGTPVRSLSISDLDVRPLTTSGTADLPAITPNGDYVVYVEHGPGGDSLYLHQLATGTSDQILAREPGVFLRGATITPDNAYVNYVRREASGPLELWQKPLLGTSTRRLLMGGAVSFSPDGREMAFVRARGESVTELMIASSDGTNERLVKARIGPKEFYWPEGPTNSIAPAWSPDGKTIAVLGGAANQGGQVVLVDVGSRTERILRHGPPLIGAGLAWLDNDTLIGSMLDRPTANMQLWLVSVSRGTFSRLTNDVNQYVGVSVTQDRDLVVTARAESSFSVVTSDAAAKDWTEAVPVKPMKGSLGFALRWLGKDLAYVSSSSDGFALFRWHTDSQSQEALSQGAGNFSASRDGSTILFFDYERGGIGRIAVNGLKRDRSTLPAGVPVDGFHVLPDGRRFVSVARPDENAGRRVNEVVIAPVDSPNQLTVVTRDRVRITRGSGGRTEVSPDGRLIAYPSFDDQQRPVIAICELANCSTRRTLPARTQWRWMPDSRALIYVDDSTRADLWVQPLDGSAPSRFTQFAADGRRIWDFDWSEDGKRIAVARGTISTNIVRLRGLNASVPER